MALISQVALDGPEDMEEGKEYGLLVSKPTELTAVHPLVTIPGRSSVFTLRDPIDDADPVAPAPGDHIAFGILGLESTSCLVRDIDPSDWPRARISLVPEAPGIHNAGDTLPVFDPEATPPTQLPAPIVEEIRSDSTAMILTPSGTLIPRVIFLLAPIDIPNARSIVMGRISSTNTGFAESEIQLRTSREVAIVGVEEGSAYDFRIFWSHPDYTTSLPARVDAHTVSGRTDTPSGLTGVSIAIVGGSALLRWDQVPDLDVQTGGLIDWRWSPELVAVDAMWTESVSIGESVDGSERHVFLPLKPGTYLAKVFDSGLRESDEIAKVSTKQASVLDYSPVLQIVEDPAFSGLKEDVVVQNNTLRLLSGQWDDISDVDSLPSWDDAGAGVSIRGTYYFASGIDFGIVDRVRLTSHIKIQIDNIYDLIDDWENIDSRKDIDGVSGAPVDSWVEVRESDDPPGDPIWSPWSRLDASEIDARLVEFRLIMVTEDRSFNIIVSELAVSADRVV